MLIYNDSTTMTEMNQIMQRLSTEQNKYNEKKTKIQATRVRASLLELKKACDNARKSTLEEAKLIQVKPRTKKLVPVETDEEIPPPLALKREKTARMRKTKEIE